MQTNLPDLKCHCDDLLITRHSDGYINRLACLYTTARLFINCPNETKWEISSEVRKVFLILAVCCILLGAGSIYGLYRYIEPQLPDVATLKDVRLQIPMQIYSADGELIAQYGEKRRIPVTLDQIHRRW